jgi:hypothetical protein
MWTDSHFKVMTANRYIYHTSNSLGLKFLSRRAQLKTRLVLIFRSEAWTRTKEYTMNIWKQDFKENIWVCKGRRTLENENKQGDRGNVTWERLYKIYKFTLICYGDVERMQNWRIYKMFLLPYDFIWPLYVDKFRLAELTIKREHCKFIPGLFVVGLNI